MTTHEPRTVSTNKWHYRLQCAAFGKPPFAALCPYFHMTWFAALVLVLRTPARVLLAPWRRWQQREWAALARVLPGYATTLLAPIHVLLDEMERSTAANQPLRPCPDATKDYRWRAQVRGFFDSYRGLTRAVKRNPTWARREGVDAALAQVRALFLACDTRCRTVYTYAGSNQLGTVIYGATVPGNGVFAVFLELGRFAPGLLLFATVGDPIADREEAAARAAAMRHNAAAARARAQQVAVALLGQHAMASMEQSLRILWQPFGWALRGIVAVVAWFGALIPFAVFGVLLVCICTFLAMIGVGWLRDGAPGWPSVVLWGSAAGLFIYNQRLARTRPGLWLDAKLAPLAAWLTEVQSWLSAMRDNVCPPLRFVAPADEEASRDHA